MWAEAPAILKWNDRRSGHNSRDRWISFLKSIIIGERGDEAGERREEKRRESRAAAESLSSC